MQTITGTPILKTPERLFEDKAYDHSIWAERRSQSPLGKIIERVEYPPEGGVLVYHKSFKYPEKGFRDDYVMASCQMAKRAFINWIQVLAYKYLIPVYIPFILYPWKYKIKVVEKWMTELLGLTYFINGHHPFIFEKKYFTPFGREMLKGVFTFLKELGIKESLADNFTMTVVSFFDLDIAYRYRLQDIFSETNNELLLRTREVRRLLGILLQREPRKHLKAKFDAVGWILVIALLHPKIRRAYKKAVSQMDVSKMGLDEADHSHVRNLSGYDFFGMTIEERNKKWPPEQHLYAEVRL